MNCMSEARLSYEFQLFEPEEHGDEWEAHSVGFYGFGETANEAVEAVVNQLVNMTEDAEYFRVHAPGVYGHKTGRKVPQVQRVDRHQVPQGERRENPPALYQVDPPKDRL